MKESELGLKLRFGKVAQRMNGEPKVIHPGFCFLIPHVDTLIRHPVRQQTIELKDQKVTLRDNTIWIVSAVLVYRINDIYKALFEINNVDFGLRNVASGKLREVLQHLDTFEKLKEIKEVSKLLMDSMDFEKQT